MARQAKICSKLITYGFYLPVSRLRRRLGPSEHKTERVFRTTDDSFTFDVSGSRRTRVVSLYTPRWMWSWMALSCGDWGSLYQLRTPRFYFLRPTFTMLHLTHFPWQAKPLELIVRSWGLTIRELLVDFVTFETVNKRGTCSQSNYKIFKDWYCKISSPELPANMFQNYITETSSPDMTDLSSL